jgi:membrane protease YdiL (CAAX protease family)
LLALLPLIYTVYHWNHALRLLADSVPLVAQWVATEEQASRVIALLLDQNGTAFVIASLVVLVILPAVGEEIIFRGSLQPLLARVLRRPHAAIWVSALIFSAIHGQWLGFVPRCLLGALFGYLALWTGSLWPSVLAHLSNNLLSLWAYRWNWLNARAVIEESDAPYRWSDAPVAWWVLLPATLIGVFLLIQLVRRSNS